MIEEIMVDEEIITDEEDLRDSISLLQILERKSSVAEIIIDSTEKYIDNVYWQQVLNIRSNQR